MRAGDDVKRLHTDRAGRAGAAVPGPAARTGQVQPRSRPGDADEQQAPFLGQVGVGDGAGPGESQRQQVLLAAGQEHDLELQALGRVQRQQRDRVGPGVERVDLRTQRDLGEKLLQVAATSPGERGKDLAGGARVHLGRRVSGSGGERPHRTAQPIRHGGAARAGQPHFPDDAGNPGAAFQQVVRALLEWQPGAGHGLTERLRLRIGAVEHRDVRQPEAFVAGIPGAAGVQRVEGRAAEQPVDLASDPSGLAALVGRLLKPN